MKIRKRRVQFEEILIELEEPLVVLLKDKKKFLIAVAIDEEDLNGSNFICVNMTDRNWNRYIDGHVDLRFLFAYPSTRIRYQFSFSDWIGNAITLTPFEGVFPEELLPDRGLFSREHTSSYGMYKQPDQKEELFIDGEWELNEFGKFYQKYSDLYAVTAALKNVDDNSIPKVLRGKTKTAFTQRPFKGGSSYMHVFDDLPNCIPRDQKISLEGINYNSPGDVRILGDMGYFSEVELLITNFMSVRSVATEQYKVLHQKLRDEKLLTAPASSFSNEDPRGAQVLNLTKALSDAIRFSELGALLKVCDGNILVASKIVLAIFRRLESAAMFFAEGRMAFERQ